MSDKLRKLYIEPTSKCNLNCTMCFRRTWFNEVFADMDQEIFENTMATMPDETKTVFFGGMGEPLFHKDIIGMVKKASSMNKRVELLTNGTLLTQEMSAALLDAGLDRLWVSIDSFETQAYESIRESSNFSLVTRNITKFNLERFLRIDKEPQLGLAFVAMKKNLNQLGLLARFAIKNQAGYVNISNVIPTDEQSLQECAYNRIINLGFMAQERDSAHPKVSLPMMDMQLAGVSEAFLELLRTDSTIEFNSIPLMRRRRYCKFIEEGNAFVRHDGDVSPCMALLHSGITYLEKNKRIVYHHSFGNVREESLKDIWNSEEYTSFRARVKNFEFSPCINCGGCEKRDDNLNDCLGNSKPTCGACLWSEGIFSCP